MVMLVAAAMTVAGGCQPQIESTSTSTAASASGVELPQSADEASVQLDSKIESLGINRNAEVSESSGLAISAVKNAYWTINDSGKAPSLFLIQQDGKLLMQQHLNAKNVDWEAMSRMTIQRPALANRSAAAEEANGSIPGNAGIASESWLVIGDVGDNLRRRSTYQLHLVREPAFPATANQIALPVTTVHLAFSAAQTHPEDLAQLQKNRQSRTQGKKNAPERAVADRTSITKSINCEAMAVDPLTNDIWFIEKVYLNSAQKTKPGIFRLPANLLTPLLATQQRSSNSMGKPNARDVRVAERVADFPVRNVTGMAFSPDGQKLIIRNYFNAHLYRRRDAQSWIDVIHETNPVVVSLPIQRQGEAVCFTRCSGSLILTSEVSGQTIWRVGLKKYLDQAIRNKK